MAEFDIISKQLFSDFPADFVRFALGLENAEVIGIIDTEQPTVESHRADSVARVNLDGVEVLVHTEFQTSDSTHTPMPRRMAGYIGWLIESYGLPVLATVIYLRPLAGRNDPGRYVQDIAGFHLVIPYQVIRLTQIPGEDVLAQQRWGLVPFAPLMQPPDGMDSESWLRECVQTVDQSSLDRDRKATLLVDTAILSGLIHEKQTIFRIIREEIMYESSVIQHFAERSMQQGIQLGQLQQQIEALQDVLAARFDSRTVEALKPTIEAISDLEILRQLLRKAAVANTLDEFSQILSQAVENNS